MSGVEKLLCGSSFYWPSLSFHFDLIRNLSKETRQKWNPDRPSPVLSLIQTWFRFHFYVVFWWLLVWLGCPMTNYVVCMSEVEDGSGDWEAEEKEQRLDWCSRPAAAPGFDVECWCVSGFMYIAVYKLLCVFGTPQILLYLFIKRKDNNIIESTINS